MKNHVMFREYMAVLSEIHDKPLSKLLTDLYWKMLEPFSDDQCKAAFESAIRANKFFPKPADLIDTITGGKKNVATLAWLEVQTAIGQIGNYQSVRFQDPVIHSVVKAMGGWPALCNRTEDPKWIQRDFERLYEVISQSRNAEHPPYLPGEHELANTRGGYDYTAPVIQVGWDKEPVKLVS